MPETPGYYAEDQILPSSQTQWSRKNVSLAGSIAFSANLRTPIDPLPSALVMCNSEDALPINENLLWTASSLSAPRPRPDRPSRP